MAYLSSGNPIVDAMGTINITGNVVPTIWYRTVLKENGKPYCKADTGFPDKHPFRR